MRTSNSNRHIIRSPDLTEDTKLYRYISFRRFMDFVETKQISLSRIINWQDTWEIPSAKLPIQADDGSIRFSLWNIGESMFGQCWSLHEESDAMWRIYSQHNEGVVIQASVKKFDLLEDIKFGALASVIYYDDLKTALDRIEGSPSHRNFEPFTQAFLKRRAFEHEKEVRLVTMDDERCLVKKPSEGVSRIDVDLDPLEFIEGITIDPRADDRHVAVLQKYCERTGFKIKPIRSTLYGNLYEHTRLVRKYIPVKK
jgi:DUF2971 family protein